MTRPWSAPATTPFRIVRIRNGHASMADDVVAGEEPLQIRAAGPGQEPVDVAVTLRTPGHEAELAVGFLHAEGLLRPGDVIGVHHGDVLAQARPDDVVTVELAIPIDVRKVASRRVAATAACGVCGKASINDVVVRCATLPTVPRIDWDWLAALPGYLRSRQKVFARTGGLHAAATAKVGADDLDVIREDIGRHNAVDAVVGTHVLAGELPLSACD